MTDHSERRTIDGVTGFLGMRFPAYGVTEIDLRDEFMNRAGLVSGGVVFTLLDYAMGTALWEQTTETEMIATTNISINYLRSARAGTIRATATVDRRNSRNASLRAEVHDAEGEVLATAVGSFAIFPRRPA
jgi:acyl-CoA thioesterase